MFNNTPERYSAVARSLHWMMALAIIGLIGLGWYMVGLTYFDPWYNGSLETHKSVGLLALVLAVVNIAWSLYARPPARSAALKPWESAAAAFTHRTLYAMMVAIPVSGYIISTSAGSPVSVFGLFDIPVLLPKNETLREAAVAFHYYAAYGTAGLVAVHALAALKHQFIDKDGTLRRML